MASGSQTLTTYYAKRIIGDSAAASASAALLQTGTGITSDIWILHRTNRSDLYGIKYAYDNTTDGTEDKIELYGGYQVDTTDTPTVQIQLNTGDMSLLGKINISNSTASTSTSTGALTVTGGAGIGGDVYANKFYGPLEGNASTATKWAAAQIVYVTLGTASTTTTIQGGSSSAQTIGVNGTLGTGYGGTGNTSFTQWGVVYANPATKLVTTAAGTSGYLLQGNGSAAPSWIQATNANTANTIVKRDGSGNFSAGTITANITGNCSGSSGSCTGNAATATALGTNAGNTNLPVYFTGGKPAACNNPASGAWFRGVPTVTSSGVMETGRYLDFHSTNASTADYGYRLDNSADGQLVGSGTLALVNNSQNNATYNALLYVQHNSGNDWGAIITKSTSYDYGLQVICKSDGSNGVSVTGRITGTKVYGAIWNDYAEYRQSEILDGGYCVVETSNGIMCKTTERLQPGCRITSDTFGFAIGETEKCKTPIAVSGRVLVYPYRAREEYPLGAAVCSAPGGTVDIMTRDEIMMYPERIVGTVSEIPNYDIWECGEGPDDVNNHKKVNGRIWIYVK